MREDKNNEFKKEISKSYLKTVCAFANYNGGKIYFGYDDNGNVVGLIGDLNKLALNIENQINDSIEPKVNFSIEVDEKDKTLILVIDDGDDKPYFYGSKSYKRNDSSTVEVDRKELKRLVLKGENKSYDEVDVNETDLTFKYLENYLIKETGISELNDNILKTLRLINIKGNYNFAAKVLSDKNDINGIDMARFGNSIDYILDRKMFSGMSLLEQYDKAVEFYRQYYQYEHIKGSKRIKEETIPEEAFREAVGNAIVHRAYDVNANIRISMYKKYIEICSPGGLVEGVKEEDYMNGNISILRNPIIGSVFNRLNIIECFGTGVKRIMKTYSSYSKKPTFKISDNMITIILPTIDYDEIGGENKFVYDLMEHGRVMTASDVADSMSWGKTKATYILNDLVSEGYVSVIGRGRGTKYKQNK